ncbi:MAG TPA: peptide deformylase [Gammaproteobacteria bacterium]|nr:peptide deformylase [Gammaproteobacteria bacterium]
MAKLPILEYPDPRLRIRAEPVTKVDEEIRQLLDDLLETMYAASGVGLAATQVDRHVRVLAVDVSEARNEPYCLINPEIVETSGQAVSDEGCLSVPEYYDAVERAERIRVRALDRAGKRMEFEAEGLLAICLQHEIDHLDGKLFVDYLSEMKRQRLRKKYLKRSRRDQDSNVPVGKVATPLL